MKVLCRSSDIPEGGARGFLLEGHRLLGVRQHGRLFFYLNRCPHLGVPLEWEEHDFLDADGAYIRCSSHGALFVKESGECLAGPCRGAFLWQLEHAEHGGEVHVDLDALPAPASAAST